MKEERKVSVTQFITNYNISVMDYTSNQKFCVVEIFDIFHTIKPSTRANFLT